MQDSLNYSSPAARTLLLSPADNVAVALSNLDAGTRTPQDVTTIRRIPKGHKLAAKFIAGRSPILKFNEVIGFASEAICPGEWLHTHNVTMGAERGAFERDYAFGEAVVPVQFVSEPERATFSGYRRANGRVGTRNYVGVLTSVNCSTTVAGFIVSQIERSGILDDFPNIDGIVALKQANGCVIDSRGVIFDMLKKTTWVYATNPNIGGRPYGGARMRRFSDTKAQRGVPGF